MLIGSGIEDKESINIYKWIAIKELHGVQKIRAEVESWDSSKNHLKLMKKVLLNEVISQKGDRARVCVHSRGLGLMPLAAGRV